MGPCWVPTFRGMSKLVLALLEVGSLLGPCRVPTFRGMPKLLFALLVEVGSLLGLCWVPTFRGMSKLLVALLEVGSMSGPGFSWDVQATLGTFGSMLGPRLFMRCPSYVWHCWTLAPSCFLSFRVMSKLLLALLWAAVGSSRLHCLGSSCGLLWAPLGFSGLRWAPLGCSGLLWAPLGSPGLRWAPLVSSGLLWALLGFSGLLFIRYSSQAA